MSKHKIPAPVLVVVAFVLCIVIVDTIDSKMEDYIDGLPFLQGQITDIDYEESRFNSYQIVTIDNMFVLKSRDGYEETLRIGDFVQVRYDGNTWYRIRIIKE